MCAKYAGECLWTIKGYPRELAAVIIKETGSQADTSSYCYIGEEGSGMGKSESDLKKALVGAEIAKGLAITGSCAADSEEAVRSWLSINGLR